MKIIFREIILLNLIYFTGICGFIGEDLIMSAIIEMPENVDIILLTETNSNQRSVSAILKTQSTGNINQFRRLSYTFGDFSECQILKLLSSNNSPFVVIILPESNSSFFQSMLQISSMLNASESTGYKGWTPRFILIWPTVSEDKQTSKYLYKDLIQNTHSKQFNLKNEVYIFIPYYHMDTTSVKFTIWDAYTIINKSIYNEIHIPHDFNWFVLINKVSRRNNFHKAELSATTTNNRNYLIETKWTNDQSKFESGSAVSRFWFIRDGLNFIDRAILEPYTTEDEKGQIIGGAAKVIKGTIDISISQTPMSASKRSQIDFLQPTDAKPILAFFVPPPASEYRDIFFKAFDLRVWISIACTWLLLVLVIRLSVWILTLVFRREDRELVIKNMLLWAVGTLAQRGWNFHPSSNTIRAIHWVANLTGLVCYTALTASMVSFFLVKFVPMKSFDDIQKASFRLFINQHSTPIRQSLPVLENQPGYPEKVLVHENYSIPQAQTSRSAVLAFAYVFFVQMRKFNFTDMQYCQTFSSLRVTDPLRNAMIVKKGAPFREFFDHQIILMYERGFNYRFESVYKRGTEFTCEDYKDGRQESLGIYDVLTAKKILITGAGLSLIVLLLEKIVALKNKRCLITITCS